MRTNLTGIIIIIISQDEDVSFTCVFVRVLCDPNHSDIVVLPCWENVDFVSPSGKYNLNLLVKTDMRGCLLHTFHQPYVCTICRRLFRKCWTKPRVRYLPVHTCPQHPNTFLLLVVETVMVLKLLGSEYNGSCCW